jgi:hypothetical protein
LKSLNFLIRLFLHDIPTKQFSSATKPFFRFGADTRKQRLAINLATRRRTAPRPESGDSQMRTVSFILAFAFILAGPSMAGSSDRSLPGAGTFSYNSAPLQP